MARRSTIVRARQLRRGMTKPELMLWQALRTRPGGAKFRRQHPLGPFVLDFYCPAARLAIEIDGIAHEMGGNPERDVARDLWVAKQGIATLRIAAREVLEDVNAVVAHILERCATPLHHAAHGPPPHSASGEEGEDD